MYEHCGNPMCADSIARAYADGVKAGNTAYNSMVAKAQEESAARIAKARAAWRPSPTPMFSIGERVGHAVFRENRGRVIDRAIDDSYYRVRWELSGAIGPYLPSQLIKVEQHPTTPPHSTHHECCRCLECKTHA